MPTHGSLTKAGKVRSQTPKVEPRHRKGRIPRTRNRRNHEKRILLEREIGQRRDTRRGRRRRRR